MKIIFKNIDNSIGIATQSEVAIQIVAMQIATIGQIAEVLTPAPYEYQSGGDDESPIYSMYYTPYWILQESEIPTDRTSRDAWEVDPSWGDHDGFGSEFDVLSAEIIAAYLEAIA